MTVKFGTHVGRDVSCTDSKDMVVRRRRKFEDEFGEGENVIFMRFLRRCF